MMHPKPMTKNPTDTLDPNQPSIVRAFVGKLGRWTHLISAASLGIAGWLLVRQYPDLAKDPVSTFSTISGISTLFGVIFAIIEVIRIESATRQAANAASIATNRLNSIYAARDATECIVYIRNALEELERSGAINASALARISLLYAGEFSFEIESEISSEKKNLSILESYVMTYRNGGKTRTANLRKALISMTTDLAKKIKTTYTAMEL